MDVLTRYRDTHDSSFDSDSDDSDKECTVWKRATVKKVDLNEAIPTSKMVEIPPVMTNNETTEVQNSGPAPPCRKRKINTIWSDVLQDQLISDDFEDVLLKNKPRDYGSRGKESYDYTLRYSDERVERDSDSTMSESALSEKDSKSEIKCSLSTHKNYRKFVKLDSAELDAARKINKVLNEKKYYLIQRIVKYVGIEKAMHLLELTKEIEDNGGMMIKTMARRRTPGGVYIQQLKEDKDVTSEILDKIFEGEMSATELKNYYKESKKKKRNFRRRISKHKPKGTSKPNDLVEDTMETMEPAEVIPMEADVITEMNLEKSNLCSNSTSEPMVNKNSPGNVSDLEDGEIED